MFSMTDPHTCHDYLFSLGTLQTRGWPWAWSIVPPLPMQACGFTTCCTMVSYYCGMPNNYVYTLKNVSSYTAFILFTGFYHELYDSADKQKLILKRLSRAVSQLRDSRTVVPCRWPCCRRKVTGHSKTKLN